MEVDVVVIESDDVANAIAEEVAKHGIHKLVIGASSRGLFTRYLPSMVYVLCTIICAIIFYFIRTCWKYPLILSYVSFLAQFSICTLNTLINKILSMFEGNLRVYPQESQCALQDLVQSMLFRKESCLLYVHPIQKPLKVLKVTVVRQVFLPKVCQATLPAHRQVYARRINSELHLLDEQ